MDTTERRWFGSVVILKLLAITLPYIWATLHPPVGAPYYSGLLQNVPDQNIYLAWGKQAAQGQFFLPNPFTTEGLAGNDKPRFVHLLFWGMGFLSAITQCPLIWIYHIFRLLFTGLALYWFYALCSLMTGDRRVRVLALVLAAFSTGSGWMQGVWPDMLRQTIFMDRTGPLMMPEAFTFTSALLFPLFIAATALLPLSYRWMLLAQQTGQMRYAIAGSCAALLAAHLHTYAAFPLMATLLIWAFLSKGTSPISSTQALSGSRPWLVPLLVVGGAVLPVAYQILIFQQSEDFRLKALMPQLPPPLLDVLLSYGLLLVLAIYGAIVSWQNAKMRLMILWAAVTLAMIYAPVIWSRRMIEGVHLPLCLLAAVALIHIMTRIPSVIMRGAFIGGVVALMCVSSVQFVQQSLLLAHNNNFSDRIHALWSSAIYRRNVVEVLGPQPARSGGANILPRPTVSDIWEGFRVPFYLTAGDAAALRFLNRQAKTTPLRAVLCLSTLGNYVPRETGLHVYLGHGNHTLRFASKAQQVVHFYSGHMPPDEVLAWLRKNHIGYVIEGYYERAFPAQTLPSRQLRLPKLFDYGGTAVYGVPPG